MARFFMVSILLLLISCSDVFGIRAKEKEYRGTYGCEGGVDGSTARFKSVKLLEASIGSAAIRKELQQAQVKGYPVIIRHAGKYGRSAITAMHHTNFVVQGLRTNVDEDDLKRFDKFHLNWAGMRSADNLSSVVAMAEDLGWKFHKSEKSVSTEIFDMVRAARQQSSEGYYFHLNLKGDVLNTVLARLHNTGLRSRYPLFPGDTRSYTIMFVQPPGPGGAHIDDLVGATYFYLHLLEGKKKFRIWPFYEQGEIQAWGCAQQFWNISTDNPELFLRGSYRKGFASDHWTDKGFEYSFLKQDTEENYNFSQSCLDLEKEHTGDALHYGLCNVEVTVEAGEEIFVPSGVPHQVTTLTPSVAVSSNFRFSKIDDPDEEMVNDLLNEMKMSTDILDWDSEDFDIDEVREAILNASDFNQTRWEEHSKQHHPPAWLYPKERNETKAFQAVTKVLLSRYGEMQEGAKQH